jgi:hypothetical protein
MSSSSPDQSDSIPKIYRNSTNDRKSNTSYRNSKDKSTNKTKKPKPSETESDESTSEDDKLAHQSYPVYGSKGSHYNYPYPNQHNYLNNQMSHSNQSSQPLYPMYQQYQGRLGMHS